VPRTEAHKRADELLAQLGLADKKDKQARTLSGGMKRRLMIARALMHKPQLLILDEPTAGVDIELRRSMWEFLKEINQQGVTIILTTHYLEEAEMLCKNIAIIDKGQIIENTNMKSLLAKLDKETFILDLKQPTSAFSLDGYTTREIDDHTIEVDVEKSQGLNGVFDALSTSGNTVLSMRNKANRLEELFVAIVEKGREQK
jgi:ABC-2 type transport system ATP-binding protein